MRDLINQLVQALIIALWAAFVLAVMLLWFVIVTMLAWYLG